NVGAMKKQNSMENATTAISMVTKQMNARKNQDSEVIVTNATNKVTRHPSADPKHSIQQNKL
ncbi:hypothetical protein, partial [[Clostridium] innocuum]|uniref:hypothetical protein n=1 Tax=Clostridium innocuum TaxID=1522 RepID=UPI001E30CAEA